jgi:hypothetical protein
LRRRCCVASVEHLADRGCAIELPHASRGAPVSAQPTTEFLATRLMPACAAVRWRLLAATSASSSKKAASMKSWSAPRANSPSPGLKRYFMASTVVTLGTWERRVAPHVVSHARVVLSQPLTPRPGRLRSKKRTHAPAPGLLTCTGRGHCVSLVMSAVPPTLSPCIGFGQTPSSSSALRGRSSMAAAARLEPLACY